MDTPVEPEFVEFHTDRFNETYARHVGGRNPTMIGTGTSIDEAVENARLKLVDYARDNHYDFIANFHHIVVRNDAVFYAYAGARLYRK